MPDVGTITGRITFDSSGAITGFEQAEKATGEWEKSLKRLQLTVAAVFVAKEIVEFGKAAIDQFSEAESAAAKLNAAFRAQGTESETAKKHAFEFAESMQHVSTATKDEIVGAERLLVSVGNLRGEGLDKATKASLNLAAALGIDLQSAASLVAKAAEGNTGALSRYGISITDTGNKATNFSAVLEQLEQKFGGQAAAELDTYAGKMSQLSHSFDDVKEAIGSKLVPALKTAAEFWTPLLDKFTKWIGLAEEGSKQTDLAAETYQALLAVYKGGPDAYAALTKEEQAYVNQAAHVTAANMKNDETFLEVSDRIKQAKHEYYELTMRNKELADAAEAARVASDRQREQEQKNADVARTHALENAGVVKGYMDMVFWIDRAVEAEERLQKADPLGGGSYAATVNDASKATEDFTENQLQLAKQEEETALETELLDTALRQASNAVMGMVFDGAKAEDVLKSLERAFAQEIITLAIKKIEANILQSRAEAIKARTGIASEAALAAATAGAAVAFGGPAASIPAAQAEYAAIIAWQAAVPAASGGEVRGGVAGIDSVPLLAMPGEVVLDTGLTQALRELVASGGMGGGLTVNVNGSADPEEIRRVFRDDVWPEMQRLQRAKMVR